MAQNSILSRFARRSQVLRNFVAIITLLYKKGEVSKIKVDEEMRQWCFLNNEERRFFDGEKMFGKTDEKTARRDWCREGIKGKKQFAQIPLIRSHYQAARFLDWDSRNQGRKKQV
jgi:hypothetical protein